ncbi:MAG: aldehyde ferredoxin oxidoreductase family protein [Candidatus Tritonobacter lacicola]|nr:aldehyde ferredoxin oxidoreductase family protein [Candidatus Tritonobacter lacicola]
MADGYFGKVLEIDLGSGEVKTRNIDDALARKYLLGSGLSAQILYTEADLSADPLSPDNPLIFMRGFLNGVPTPGSSKFNVCSKSPLTGIWNEACAGGHWPATFSFTGNDGIIFTGASEKPVYIYLTDEKCEIRDASHVWGKDTFETSEILKAETGKNARVASIGPAGEKLVRIASIMFDGTNARAAGRSGMGAVMGSKKLKAVVVAGGKRVPIHDRDKMKALLKEQIPDIVKNTKGLRDFSTAGGVEAVELHGDLPIKNWQLGSFEEGATKLCAQTFLPKTLFKHYACWACPIRCAKIIKVDKGPWAPLFGHGPEYETIAGFGSMCLNDDYEVVMAANELCNRLGLDTISAGGAVAFAMEAREKGIITDDMAEGLKLEWGNGEAIVGLTKRIGLRETELGWLLGDGVKRASEKLGKNSAEFAIHTKGLEYPYHDPRAFVSMAPNYATANRGACHLEALSYFLGRGIPLPDMGYTEPPDPHSQEGKGSICYDLQNFMGIFNPLGLCKFLFLGRVGPKMIAGWMRAVTGWDMDDHELLAASERIVNIKRLYNVRLGVTRKDDVLPRRLLTQPRPSGRAKGVLPQLDRMLDELYDLRGWSDDGIPRKETVERLGLSDVVKDSHLHPSER